MNKISSNKRLPKPPASGLPKEPKWYDAAHLTLEGKEWRAESRTYERLPSRAEGHIPERPWRQSLCSAGISIRFKTNAPMLYARWIDYNYEWATNQSPGNWLSLYVRSNNKWRWLGTSKEIVEGRPTLKLLNDNIKSAERDYLLYLPHGRGVRHLDIGIPESCNMTSLPRRTERPVVFYGTSIVHGAGSIPGLDFVAHLERQFDYPFINLGFSGSACMEPEVIDLVSEIDAAVFVIDCLPNMVAKGVRERFVPAIHALRKAHPKTPIIVVESLLYEDGFLIASRKARCEGSNAALRTGYAKLLHEGVRGLSYVKGTDLFGGELQVTGDGTHPTDFGYRCMAKVFTPLLERYIKK